MNAPRRGGGLKPAVEGNLKAIRTVVNPVAARAMELQIVDAGSHDESLRLIDGLKKGIRIVTAFFEPGRTATKNAAKVVRLQEAEVLDPLKAALEVQLGRSSDYEKAANAAAEAEQRRADKAAREDRRALAEGEAADAAIDGDTVAADRILEAEAVAPPARATFVEPQVATHAKLSGTVHPFAVLDSLPKLIVWAAEDTTNRAFYLSARMPALNQWAKIDEKVRPPIPGVSADYHISKRSNR